jgi:hypothetical protein
MWPVSLRCATPDAVAGPTTSFTPLLPWLRHPQSAVNRPWQRASNLQPAAFVTWVGAAAGRRAARVGLWAADRAGEDRAAALRWRPGTRERASGAQTGDVHLPELHPLSGEYATRRRQRGAETEPNDTRALPARGGQLAAGEPACPRLGAARPPDASTRGPLPVLRTAPLWLWPDAEWRTVAGTEARVLDLAATEPERPPPLRLCELDRQTVVPFAVSTRDAALVGE